MKTIDADKAIENIAIIAKAKAKSDAQQSLVGRIIFMLEGMPAIDAQPVRHGCWLFYAQKNGYLWKCSKCKGNFDQQFSYCPHCGSRMDGENNEN